MSIITGIEFALVFHFYCIAMTISSSNEKVNESGVVNPISQYNEVEMTENPAYGGGPVDLLQKDPQYEYVRSITNGCGN